MLHELAAAESLVDDPDFLVDDLQAGGDVAIAAGADLVRRVAGIAQAGGHARLTLALLAVVEAGGPVEVGNIDLELRPPYSRILCATFSSRIRAQLRSDAVRIDFSALSLGEDIQYVNVRART